MRQRMVAALAAIALCTLTGCTVTHSGTAKPGTSVPNVAQSLNSIAPVDLRKKFAESPQETNSYWTSDRLKNAKAQQPTANGTGANVAPDTGSPEKINPTTGDPGTSVPPTVSDGSQWSKTGLSGRTNGRLYFELDGSTFVCSATVVNSTSHALVATAGHCAWNTEGDGGWGRYYMFVPADANNAGQAPYGRWFADSVYVPEQFQKNAKADLSGAVSGDGWAHDIAFLRMAPNNGLDIQDVTGGQGIAFGIPAEGVTVIGYPSAPPFDGTSERFCAAPNWQPGDYGDYQIHCAMTQGASGGGWFTNFNASSSVGAGYLVSVTSIGGTGSLMGARLGTVAADLYHKADSNSS